MRILHVAAAAAAAALICGTANAGEIITSNNTPSVGVGMICNTPEQAKQFLELRAKGVVADQAMKKVNEDAQNPRACGIAAIAFVPDKMVDAKPAMRVRWVIRWRASGPAVWTSAAKAAS